MSSSLLDRWPPKVIKLDRPQAASEENVASSIDGQTFAAPMRIVPMRKKGVNRKNNNNNNILSKSTIPVKGNLFLASKLIMTIKNKYNEYKYMSNESLGS